MPAHRITFHQNANDLLRSVVNYRTYDILENITKGCIPKYIKVKSAKNFSEPYHQKVEIELEKIRTCMVNGALECLNKEEGKEFLDDLKRLGVDFDPTIL